MRLACLVLVVCVGNAAADNKPFAAYYSPAPMCDARPVTKQCRAAERAEWRRHLADKLGDPFRHQQSLRLVDLFLGSDVPRGGWAFQVIVPHAPARSNKLAITLGGVTIPLAAHTRYVREGSLVLEIAIERTKLAPGKHTLLASDGTKTVFSLDLTLEDGAADEQDPAGALAADAAAAKRPPFLVAALPTKPDCSPTPPPAGCHRAEALMWRELFLGTRANHPHATRFVAHTRPDRGSPLWHWRFSLVFPTAPADWGYADLRIELDGKPVAASPRHKTYGTEALIVQLTLLADHVAAGKHELRAVDRNGKALFARQIELVR